MSKPVHIPYENYRSYPEDEMKRRTRAFYEDIRRRRTVRDFSSRDVPVEIIENAIRAAGTAPSGANQQPWHFVAVQNPEVKHRIRVAAEEEERAFYHGKAPDEWLNALEHLGTDEHKPFLEIAPYLIAIFAERYQLGPEGEHIKNYYVSESVGIATGMLITALHTAGLATLTHTPSPMNFLNEILGRPDNEKPYILLVVGYPAEGVTVPKIEKKSLEEIMTLV